MKKLVLHLINTMYFLLVRTNIFADLSPDCSSIYLIVSSLMSQLSYSIYWWTALMLLIASWLQVVVYTELIIKYEIYSLLTFKSGSLALIWKINIPALSSSSRWTWFGRFWKIGGWSGVTLIVTDVCPVLETPSRLSTARTLNCRQTHKWSL